MRLIYLILFLPTLIFGQKDNVSPTPENFEKVMAIQNPDLEELKMMVRIGNVYWQHNRDSATQIFRHIKASNDSLKAINQYALGKAIEAKLLAQNGFTKKAERQVVETKESLTNRASPWIKGQIDLQLATVYGLNFKEKRAMQNQLSALEHFEEAKDSRGIFSIYMNLISSYVNLKLPEKIREYLKKAERIVEQENDNRMRFSFHEQKSSLYNELAEQFYATQQMDSVDYYDQLAAKEIDRAIELVEKYGYKGEKIYVFNNAAPIYMNAGKIPLAVEILEKSAQLATNFDSKIDFVHTKYSLAGLYLHLGKYDISLREATEGYTDAKKNGLRLHQTKLLDLLWQNSWKKDDFRAAFNYLLEYHNLKDSLTNAEKTEMISKLEIEYQTTQKENEILQQQTDILELENQKERVSKQRNYLLGGGLLTGLLFLLGNQIQKNRRERKEKQAFTEALMTGQESERKRIAQDLHDGIGQSLLLIKKQLSRNNQVSIDNQQLITQTLEEVRAISRSLHPFQLEKFGLKATILDVLEKVEQASDLFITHDIDDSLDSTLPEKSQIHLYRTIQEAMNNVLKHAEASAAQVLIERNEQGFLVKIQDNGKGFDHELAIVKSKSLGLRTMQERMASIGGKFAIGSISSGGTKIEIQLPV